MTRAGKEVENDGVRSSLRGAGLEGFLSSGERSRPTGLRDRLGWIVMGRLWGEMRQGGWREKKATGILAETWA